MKSQHDRSGDPRDNASVRSSVTATGNVNVTARVRRCPPEDMLNSAVPGTATRDSGIS